MKIKLFAFLALAFLTTLNSQLSTLFAQGTAFTYQGRLTDGTNLANGAYDFRFRLFDALTNGSFSGGVVMLDAVGVSNGLFTVTLAFNGAAFAFDGSARWLDIGVRSNGSPDSYLNLVPRQAITATPYAITAGTVTGAIADSQLSGNVARLNSNAVFTGTVVFSNAASQFAGTFTGNGAGVTNMNLILNSAGAITPNSSLFSLASMAAVNYPGTLVAADVNGDGWVDLITPLVVSTEIQVLTNDSRGRFTLATPAGAFSHPSTVVATDINGDARMDLISAGGNPNKLTISTNDGNGIFNIVTSILVGNSPIDVLAADVNVDGRMDFVTANYTDGTLSVVLNNSPGGFILASSPAVGSGPASVAAGDVNGDGRVDLISANSGANTLSVLTNNGSGFFTMKTNLVVGAAPYSVVAADINGDGRVDLISANSGTNTLSVLTNNGSGGFVLAATPRVGPGPQSVTARDVNADGWVDLISANSGTNTLSVLTNNGSGGFVLAALLNVGVEYAPLFVTTADVNGDGRMDVISAGYSGPSGSKLAVFLNTPFDFAGRFSGSFTGPIDAANVLTGIIPDARLSDDVARLNKSQTFTFPKYFTDEVGFMGKVGVGTTNPAVGMHVARGLAVTGSSSPFLGAGAGVFLESGGTSGQVFAFNYNSLAPLPLVLNSPGGNVGIGRTPAANALEVEGNASKAVAGSWLANSDARIKTDVRTVTGALDKLAQVRPVEFRYTAEYRAQHPSIEDRPYLNVIAQEFQRVFPEAVKRSGDRLPNGDDILQVDTYPLTIYSAAAIRELNQKLTDELRQKQTEIMELKQRLEKLERLMHHKNGGGE